MDRVLPPSLAPHLSHCLQIPSAKTFAEAAASYIEHRDSNVYLHRIIGYFGDRLLATIYPFDLHQMAMTLYPDAINSM